MDDLMMSRWSMTQLIMTPYDCEVLYNCILSFLTYMEQEVAKRNKHLMEGYVSKDYCCERALLLSQKLLVSSHVDADQSLIT